MSDVHLWAELTRSELADRLADALVIVTLGATEQHGPHLPTGTDYLVASTIANDAARRAAHESRRDFIVAPVVSVGASDHHLTLGPTVSLSAGTMLAVVTEMLTSIARSGARRIVIVNGHGGNSGICATAASTVSTETGATVAHLDYWQSLPSIAMRDFPVPGHAGTFESAMVLAIRPDLVRESSARDTVPDNPGAPGVAIYSAQHWRAIDGYSDHPERATVALGDDLRAELTAALAHRFIDLAASL